MLAMFVNVISSIWSWISDAGWWTWAMRLYISLTIIQATYASYEAKKDWAAGVARMLYAIFALLLYIAWSL